MPLDDIVEQNLRLMADLRKGGTRGRLGVRRHRACSRRTCWCTDYLPV
jgi:hypothetical protein